MFTKNKLKINKVRGAAPILENLFLLRVHPSNDHYFIKAMIRKLEASKPHMLRSNHCKLPPLNSYFYTIQKAAFIL